MGPKGETMTAAGSRARRIRTGRPRRGLAAAGATIALVAAGCGSASSTPPGSSNAAQKTATTTLLLLDWFPNPDHISLYLAQQNGDFAAQGLNVKFQSPSNVADALKLVSLGQIPLAISYEPNMITAAAKGLNVTTVGALIPTPLDTLILSGKRGVTEPSQLAGKSVGTTGDPVVNAIYGAVVKKYGIAAGQTKLVSVSEGLIPAMVLGRVSAIIGGYRNVEAIQLGLKGLDPRVFRVDENGVPTYDELVVVANKKKLASDPAYRATVKDFLAGLAKGDAAAQADPAAALAAITRAAKGYTATELRKMVEATAPLLKNSGGFGAMDITAWQHFADWMKTEGLIDRSVNAGSVVDASLLPKG
jgi:putative hydroxymethylpyrimidine transport system substrate-binding protein